MTKVKTHGCQKCEVYHKSVFADKKITLQDIPKQVRKLKKGEFLFHENEVSGGVFCLAKGRILIQKNNTAGHTQLLATAEPGEILGAGSIFHGRTYSTSAVSLTDSEACFIARESFQELAREYPFVSANTMRMLTRKMQKLEMPVYQPPPLEICPSNP